MNPFGWDRKDAARLRRGAPRGPLPDLPRGSVSWRETTALALLLEALGAGLLPAWITGVRLSTWREDQCGWDLVVETDRGPMGLQVWSETKSMAPFRRRHGWRLGLAVVRFGRAQVKRGTVVALCLASLETIRNGAGATEDHQAQG